MRKPRRGRVKTSPTSRERIREARDYAEAIVETVREPLLVLDAALRVQTANRSFYQTFQVSSKEREQQLLYDLGDGQWNIPRLRVLLEEILPQNTEFRDFEVDHEFAHIGPKTMRLNARRIRGEDDRTQFILLAIEDITERSRGEAERARLLIGEQTAREKAEAATRAKDEFVAMVSHELRTPLISMLGWVRLLRSGTLEGADSARALETVERNAHSQEKLINDLFRCFTHYYGQAPPGCPPGRPGAGY